MASSALVINGSNINSGIVSKAKFALGITSTKPINKQTCGASLWSSVVEELGRLNNIPQSQIDIASARLDLHGYP